jgi:hypothetical protein
LGEIFGLAVLDRRSEEADGGVGRGTGSRPTRNYLAPVRTVELIPAPLARNQLEPVTLYQ